MADDVRATLAAFRRLPKEASASLRERSAELAGTLAGRVQSAARGQGRQAPLVGPTVKARRDRVPVIQMGGSKRVGRHRVPVHTVMWGAEFGSNRFRQFRPHRGREGYFFYPTVNRDRDVYLSMWNKIADEIGRSWVRDQGPAVSLKGLL